MVMADPSPVADKNYHERRDSRSVLLTRAAGICNVTVKYKEAHVTATVHSILVVRRSIHIAAPPSRVWEEFSTFERMNRWWGVMLGAPEAGKANGQRLVSYEPRLGGHVEMEVLFSGSP